MMRTSRFTMQTQQCAGCNTTVQRYWAKTACYRVLAVTVRNGRCHPVGFTLGLFLALLRHLLKPARTCSAFAVATAHAGRLLNLALAPSKFVHCLHFSSPIYRAFIGRTANPAVKVDACRRWRQSPFTSVLCTMSQVREQVGNSPNPTNKRKCSRPIHVSSFLCRVA